MSTAALPKFSITPTQSQLDEMDRRLAFVPSKVTNPKVLAREQVDKFNRDGYVLGMRVFSPDEMAVNREYFDDLLARVLASGKDSYSISTAHMYYGPVWDLLKHPRIVDCVADLLGPNVIGWGSHYFCKLPRDGRSVTWHQDASYWPLSPSKTVTVWLAVDDADRENGCLRFIAGSHKFGPLEYRESSTDEANVLNQTIDDVEQYGSPVDVMLKSGEVSIHSDLLLHGSEANYSDRRRCGLTLRYCTPDVQAYLDWHLKGVVVRGADPTGHWGNPGRPSGN